MASVHATLFPAASTRSHASSPLNYSTTGTENTQSSPVYRSFKTSTLSLKLLTKMLMQTLI